ncbi:MAG: putative glycoside hydrolase [bacterium]
MAIKHYSKIIAFPILAVVFVFAIFYFLLPPLFGSTIVFSLKDGISVVAEIPKEIITHVKTPDVVKAVYMTSCVASAPSLRAKIENLIDETEINSVVIDIKDYTGQVSFLSDNPLFKDAYSTKCPVKNMKEIVKGLHEKNIYVIGRITVFQDLYAVKTYPELAIKLNSNKNVPWKDRKGLSFIDAGSTAHGDYIAALAEESYNKFGFDELNFDYIRFPSDGNMQDIYFPFSEQVVEADPQFGKAIVVRDFFARLSARLKPQGIKMSADLFGMTTTNTDDLNIGQVLEYAAPYFDYLAPMVYPSHYPVGFNGWKDPNKVPYEIVKFSMDKAVARLQIASTSIQKLRPWLQDNDYPVPYTPEMVRAQIKATYDSGLTSWMLWDAANTYTRAALLNE